MRPLAPRSLRGFNLIETLIAVAIMLVLGAALALLYRSVTTLHAYERALHGATEAVGSIRHAVDEAVRPASHVLVSHSFTAGSYSTGPTTLVLEAPSVDASGSVIDGLYDYIAFYLSDNAVYRLAEPNAASARRAGTMNLGSVTSLVFTYDSATMSEVTVVTLDVTASSTLRGSTAASRVHESVRLRNN